MDYEIRLTQIDATPMLFVRRRIEVASIALTLAELLPRVHGYIVRAGIALAGPPFARYTDWSPGRVTLEAGLPIAGEVRPDDTAGIESGRLGPARVAVTTHAGEYEHLSRAHAAIEAWLEANGLEPAGAPWESYVTDPGTVPDPRDWRTEVCWPVRG